MMAAFSSSAALPSSLRAADSNSKNTRSKFLAICATGSGVAGLTWVSVTGGGGSTIGGGVGSFLQLLQATKSTIGIQRARFTKTSIAERLLWSALGLYKSTGRSCFRLCPPRAPEFGIASAFCRELPHENRRRLLRLSCIHLPAA